MNAEQRIARARELCDAAGFPLRDRWGYEVDDEDVLYVLAKLDETVDDHEAAEAIGIGGALGAHRLASGYDMPTTEEYEAGIVTALRPLAYCRVRQ